MVKSDPVREPEEVMAPAESKLLTFRLLDANAPEKVPSPVTESDVELISPEDIKSPTLTVPNTSKADLGVFVPIPILPEL